MSTISSLGVGSGLDLNGLLSQMQTAESQPLVDIQAKQTSYTSKLSAYGQLKNALATLQTAADKLSDPTFFQSVKVSSSATGVLTATADGTATAGNYNVNVTQLAAAQSIASAGQASAKTAIGNGTITINFGTISGGSFDAATGKYTGASFAADTTRTAVPITIDSSNNTLEGIRDAINTAKAGVTASIVNDGSGTPNRLVLTSTATGAASTMQISVAGDAPLQNLLNYDPAGTQNLQQTIKGQDAQFTVNNIAMTRSSNTVEEAIQGTTMSLSGLGSTTVGMQFDTDTVTSGIGAFVDAYNAMQATVDQLTAPNTDPTQAGPLVGDATLRGIMNSLRSVLTSAQAGDADDLKVLTSVGISMNVDNSGGASKVTLALDEDKLDAAVKGNLAGVAKLFSSATGSTSGIAKQVSAFVDTTTGTGGALQAATDGVNTTLKELDDQYTTMSARVDATMAIYRKQFSDLDVAMNSMNNTLTYLKQQFASMNGSN